MEVAECSRETAEVALKLADVRAKVAILHVLTGKSIADCETLLAENDGRLRAALVEEAAPAQKIKDTTHDGK